MVYEALWIAILVVFPIALGGESEPVQLAGLLAILLAFVTLVLTRPARSGRDSDPWTPPLVGWTITVTASTVLSIDRTASAWELAAWLSLVALFVLVRSTVTTRGPVARLVAAAGLTATACSVHGLLETLAGQDRVLGLAKQAYAGHVTGTFFNSSHFAALLVMTIPASLAMAFVRVSPLVRLAWCACCLVQAAALVMTRSRGGWLAFAAAVAVAVVLGFRHRGGWKWLSGAVLVGLLALVLIGAFVPARLAELEQRLASVDLSSPEGMGLFGRLALWRGTVALVESRPVLGSGPGTFDLAFLPYRPPGYFYRLSHAHCEYLQVAAETGLAGLALLAWLVLVLARTCVRAVDRAPDRDHACLATGLASGTLGLLVECAWDWPLHVPACALTLAIFAGALAALADGDERHAPGTSSLPGALAVLVALPCLVMLVTRIAAEVDRSRGAGLLAAGDLEGAIEANRRALSRWRGQPRLWTDQARLLEAMAAREVASGQRERACALRDAALEAALEAVSSRPLDPDALRALATAHYRRVFAPGRTRSQAVDDMKRAIACAGAAVRLDPNHHVPRIQLGNLLSNAGELDLALVEFRAALATYPCSEIGKYPEVVHDIAPVRELLGQSPASLSPARRDLALAVLRERKARAPDDFRPYRLLAEAYRRLGMTAEAAAEARAESARRHGPSPVQR